MPGKPGGTESQQYSHMVFHKASMPSWTNWLCVAVCSGVLPLTWGPARVGNKGGEAL